MSNRTGMTIGGLFACLGVLLAAAPVLAQAKDFVPLRFDTGIGGAYAPALGRAGIAVDVEPKILITNNVAIGLRAEGAVLFGGSVKSDNNGGSNVSLGIGVLSSTLFKGEYLFTESDSRPFLGLGFGVYYLGSQSVDNASVSQGAGRYWGLAPQVGFDLGAIRLAATYNFLIGADIEVTQTVNSVAQKSTASQSYFTFDLAFRFGGRHRAASQ